MQSTLKTLKELVNARTTLTKCHYTSNRITLRYLQGERLYLVRVAVYFSDLIETIPQKPIELQKNHYDIEHMYLPIINKLRTLSAEFIPKIILHLFYIYICLNWKLWERWSEVKNVCSLLSLEFSSIPTWWLQTFDRPIPGALSPSLTFPNTDT